jgi:TatD DNase family protein
MLQLPLVDCHCHLDRGVLACDAAPLRAMLARCRQQQVRAMVVSVDCSGGRPEHDLDALGAVFDQCGVGLGISLGFMPPTRSQDLASALARQDAAVATITALARHPRVVAVGEVGLDYYWPVVALVSEGLIDALPSGDPPPPEAAWHLPAFQAYRALQLRVFARWIAVAHQIELPLVIHERLAHADTVALLAEGPLPPDRVMFHCFGAGPDEARAAAARGSVVSIPSSVVVRPRYREVAALTPLEALVIETDSPYHSPIVGLWKLARQAALDEVALQDVPKKRREAAINQARDTHLNTALERDLPGLVFQGVRDGQPWSHSSLEHFRSAKARYLNEPTFVRFAAREIACLQGRDPLEVQQRLLERSMGFFGLGGIPESG